MTDARNLRDALESEEQRVRLQEAAAVYSEAMLSFTMHCSINDMSKDLKSYLTARISREHEGKCAPEGFIEPESCKVVTYSGGQLSGAAVKFEVVAHCRVCNPVVGMTVECVVKNVTKTAGVRAELALDPSPMVIYLARDHHLGRTDFSELKIGDRILASILGVRFELNDKYISVIAELVPDNPVKDI